MHSFIVTITIEARPIVLHLISETGNECLAYEVSALSNKDFTPFTIVRHQHRWKITTEVQSAVKRIEPRLSDLIEAYLRGQGMLD